MGLITEQELLVLKLYQVALFQKKIKMPENVDWDALTDMAMDQYLLPFFYERIGVKKLPAQYRAKWSKFTKAIIGKNYELLSLTKYVVHQLEANGIEVLVLKGVGVSALYPYPELRKSGDVDFVLLDPQEVQQADKVLLSLGFIKPKDQPANHHIIYLTPTGIEIEMHISLVEDFDDRYMNRYLHAFQKRLPYHRKKIELFASKLPVMTDGYMAFHLLLHMLQHFLREGFGLRLLGDWVVFWSRNVSAASRATYERHVKKCGLEGFSNMITSICHYYLGLENGPGELISKKECEQYLRDILDSGEFGSNENDRMIVMKESGFTGYVRTFHHMTRLNYPGMSKVPVLWPALWTATLHKFVKNNKELNRPSTSEILKTANRRSKGVKQLQLFDKKRRKEK